MFKTHWSDLLFQTKSFYTFTSTYPLFLAYFPLLTASWYNFHAQKASLLLSFVFPPLIPFLLFSAFLITFKAFFLFEFYFYFLHLNHPSHDLHELISFPFLKLILLALLFIFFQTLVLPLLT